MAVAQKTKASDRQGVCKRLLSSLKKRYTGRLPKLDLPVLETMLFAACLENSTPEQAEAAIERLLVDFHDLNEIRVSSVKEAESVFDGLSHPDWRALRIRSVLQYVFEETYSFQFEGLKRKTLDSAAKQLSKINYMTPFMRLFTLQQSLGSHLLPVDDQMAAAVIWLGLAEPGTSPEKISGLLKSSVRKADSPLFCHLLRCLATDEKYTKLFDSIDDSESYDLTTAIERIERLFKRGASAFVKTKKKAAPKTSSRKAPAKKTAKTAKSKSSPQAARKKAGKKTVKVAKPKSVKKKPTRTASAKKKTVVKKKTAVKKKNAVKKRKTKR